ncbi:TPA: single-stranded DNA-binding protein [Streptococcus suis]
MELKYTGSQTAVATGTLAVNRQFKNANGEKEADFINIVAWRKTAEIIANYTSKGSQIGITGRIQTRNYDGNDGKRVYVTEVVAETVMLLDNKSNNQQPQPQQKQERPFNNSNPIDVDDLELPF